ncbi:class I SAM-dependent methyltransferase [Persephonella sp.]
MDIGKRFDQVAEKYDTPDKVERSKKIAEYILKNIPINQKFKVIDVGCGTGTVDIFLAGYIGEIYGFDLSEGMLNVFRKKIKDKGINNIFVYKKDPLYENIDINGADLVLTSMTLHHIDDVSDGIKKLSKFLKKGGYLVAVDLEKEDGTFHSDNTDVKHFGFDKGYIENLFEKNGFKDIKVETLFSIDKERDGKLKSYPVFIAIGKKSI